MKSQTRVEILENNPFKSIKKLTQIKALAKPVITACQIRLFVSVLLIINNKESHGRVRARIIMVG